jgi:hypothetical protein
MSDSDNSTAESFHRPYRIDAEGAGSELGRQIPVNLQADADLNEDRGCPGHWSTSLNVPSDKQKCRLDQGPQPGKPGNNHAGESIGAGLSARGKGVLLQTPRPGGTPGDMPTWPIIGGRKGHSMHSRSGHLASCPIKGSSHYTKGGDNLADFRTPLCPLGGARRILRWARIAGLWSFTPS